MPVLCMQVLYLYLHASVIPVFTFKDDIFALQASPTMILTQNIVCVERMVRFLTLLDR